MRPLFVVAVLMLATPAGSRFTRVAPVDTGGVSSGNYKEFHSTRAVDPTVRPPLVIAYTTSAPAN